MEIHNIVTEVNNLVIKGLLPLAFYNSEILNIKTNRKVIDKKFITKYSQKNIPRADSNKCISKIYDFF